MLAGLILAGGKSSRMGSDKSLLKLPDSQQSLLEQCQKSLLLLGDNHLFISGSAHQNGIADVIPNCGPLSGIHAVITHIQKYHSNIKELLVAAVDMPDLCADDYICLLNTGRKNQRLCCFENCFLPLYIPLSDEVTEYLNTALKYPHDATTIHAKKRQHSVKMMLDTFKGLQIKPLNNSRLNNINTPVQWQQHCAEQILYQCTDQKA
jgi:molybdopterin-guanine dinucleotide biosynthesis protein A